MTLIRSLRFLIILFTFISISHFSYGQSTELAPAKVQINSNYDSFFIVIDDSLESAVEIESNSFFEIEPGNRSIRIVPEYSKQAVVNATFVSDSIHIIDITFTEILDTSNKLFLSLRDKNSNVQTKLKHLQFTAKRSHGFSMLSDSMYQASQNKVINYRSTYLKIETNVDSLFVKTYSDQSPIRKIANGDSIKVQPGSRYISISHRNGKERNLYRFFKDSSTTVIKHDFELKDLDIDILSENLATKPSYNSNLIIVSDEDSEITINGKYFGFGAAKTNMRTGPIDVIINNKSTGKSVFSEKIINNTNDRATVVNAYTKPVLKTARFRSVLPGYSQIYKRQRIKGFIFSSSFLVTGYLSIKKNSEYKSELGLFHNLEEKYDNATTENEALQLGDQVVAQQKITQKKDNERLVLFLSLIHI